MRLDHISYACGPDGLEAAVARLSSELGVPIAMGGVHPRFGTRNAIVPLADGIYLEVVGVLEHPAADKAPFGRAVKRKVAEGGGWLGWVVAVDDVSLIESRLGRSAVAGHRTRPDGQSLSWAQIGVRDMLANPALPFFIQWGSEVEEHPSAGPTGLRLTELEIAGDRDVLATWLSDESLDPMRGVHLSWVNGPSGLVSACFDTPLGPVRIS